MKPLSHIRFIAAVCMALPPSLRAEEGAAGHYLPGLLGTAMDLGPEEPGLSLSTDFIGYSGKVSVNRSLPFAGKLFAGLKADMMLWDFTLAYTLESGMAGASWTAGVSVPLMWLEMNAEAELTGPLGRTAGQLSDSAEGLSDLVIIPASLTWKRNDWKFNFQTMIYAPTGDYGKEQLANLGKNHWTFDPNIGFSHISPRTGAEVSAFAGFAMSTENPDTHYRGGNVFHADASVSQYIRLGPHTAVSFGVAGSYYQQVAGDSGEGAILGDFKGRSLSAGPVVNFVRNVGEGKIAAQFKWLPELDTRHRLEGDWLWFSLGWKF